MTNLNADFSISDDINITHHSEEINEKYFTEVIGCIEDTLMDTKFRELHSEFMEEHWREFEDTDENKFVYMDIFKKYNRVIEKFIEDELVRRVEGFDMLRFEEELKNRRNELDGEIFEILSTFSDFLAFKSMFLDYKAMKEGRVVDFSQDFSVCKLKLQGQ